MIKIASDMAEKEKFIFFKNGKTLNNNDFKKYTDDNILNVVGLKKDTYYTSPSEILLVSSSINYKKIPSNIIFVKDSQDGYIIVKKYKIK